MFYNFKNSLGLSVILHNLPLPYPLSVKALKWFVCKIAQNNVFFFFVDTSLNEITSTTATEDSTQVIRVIKVTASDSLPFTMKDIASSSSKVKM